MVKEFYNRLGVSESASQDEIKSAYRNLAKEYHPDRPNGNESLFKELGEAWDVLKDPKTRREYDNPQPQFNFRSSHFTNTFDGFEDIFAQFSQRRQIKRYKAVITILESINGRKITINGEEYSIPPGVMSGSSFRINENEQLVVMIRNDPKFTVQGYSIHTSHPVPIIECILGGEIHVKTVCDSTLKINIPAGSDHTTVLKVSGYGMMHPQTRTRQEMLIHIEPIMPKDLTNEEKELYNSIRNLKDL